MKVHPKNGKFTQGHLFALSDLDDYEVESDELNVTGWDVTGGDGKKLGRVEELIVDPSALKVRYLLIEVDDDISMIDGDHYILVPIGVASLVEDHDVVLIKDLSAGSVNSYPIFDHTGTSIIRDYERNIRTFYAKENYPEDDLDFYTHEHFNDSRFYNSRRKS